MYLFLISSLVIIGDDYKKNGHKKKWKKGGKHEEISKDGVDPQGVQIPQGVQVPPLGDQVPIGGEGN